jgi:uncharacterized protein YbaP (TraB family)
MKRSTWFLILIRYTLTSSFVLLFVFSIQSQSLLYKVTGSEISNPIYLYGTIHALPQADFFVDDKVMEVFGKAEKIVFEIDMSSPNMMAEVQSAMMMQGNSIDQLVTEDEYIRLKQFFADSLQLPIEMLKNVKPLLMASFMLSKIVGELPASYEGFFMQKAMEMGKPIAGIETVAEQVGYLDKIPLETQAKMLMESIDDFNQSRIEFQDLVNVYKTRDVERVYKVLMESSDEYKEFGEHLIDARNISWIPRIVEMGNQYICFIAVGCGHLGGEKGILNLLVKEGFNVDPVEK